jgi:hypothetical protein
MTFLYLTIRDWTLKFVVRIHYMGYQIPESEEC